MKSESVWRIALMATLGYLLVAYALVAFFGPGVRHLAFQTDRIEATLVGYTSVGSCERDAPQDDLPEYRLTLTWVDEGEERTGDYTTCEDVDRTRGARLEAWVTGSGDVSSLTGPLPTHLKTLILPGIVLVLGSAAALADPYMGPKGRERRRRRSGGGA